MTGSGDETEGTGIRAEREFAGRRAASRVRLRSGAEPDAALDGYAGALAWLEIADDCTRDRDFGNAVEASQRGLDELGTSYRYQGLRDDTGTKLKLAQMRARDGALEPASEMLVRTLRTRLHLFATGHAAELASEPDSEGRSS